MTTIEWSTALELGVAVMDDTHRDFARCVNAVTDAPEDRLLAELDALIAHTEEHFGQEDRWMGMLPFPPIHCHMSEHEGVLGVMKEARGHVVAGNAEVGRVLARELGPWFENHAKTMDAMLAYVIKLTGFDPANPQVVKGMDDLAASMACSGDSACAAHDGPPAEAPAPAETATER